MSEASERGIGLIGSDVAVIVSNVRINIGID